MRRALSIMLMALILGLSFSAAVSQSFVLAETQEDEAYEEFWDILNREAELIVELNSTSNESEILELAQELIQNSQNGSHNAAQISALIWQGLEELENSGVKTYYTAEELREMAQNITQNGLPNETVQLLKQQGWSDEEIQALQEYIAENAENITEDFNLTAFLENFSTAFVQVAFKYNYYEAWALKRLANANKPSISYAITWSEETEVPFIWDDFKEFNRTFSNASLDEKLNLTRSLKEKIANFITSGGEKILYRNYTILYAENASEYRKCFAGRPWLPIRRELNSTYSWLRNSTVHQIDNMSITSIRNFLENFTSTDSLPIGVTSTVKVLKVIPQGDSVVVMIITRSFTMYFSPKDCSTHFSYYRHYDMYYWKGFKAYEKLSNLQTILEAKAFGNEDPTLDEIVENITQNLSEYFKTYKRGESEFGESIISRLISPPSDPRPPKAKSSPMSGDEGHLYIVITVNNGHVTEDYATYRVKVSLQAMNNVVTDVNVEVEGTGLSDSTHYGMIHPQDGAVIWYSRESDEVYGSGSVSVSGTVRVTYTPSCGDLPNSGSVPLTCNQPTTITEPYSVTINLTESTIDPDKVTFKIVPSDSRVRAGESVTFYVKVVNENDEPVNGSYELNIAVPGSSEPITKRGSISVSSNDDSGLIPVTTITYIDTGTYGYSGTFKFNGYEKHDDGDIIVESDDGGSSGSLSIESVSVSPHELRDGSAVNFTVKVKSTYDSGKIIKLKLYVDGLEVDEVTDSINGNSEGTFVLHWLAQAGEHSYTVKAYTLIGGQEFIEDEESGNLNVGTNDDFTGILSANITNDVSVGVKARFTLTVRNDENVKRYSIPVRVYYVYTSPDGVWHSVIKVKEAEVDFDPLGEYQDWFDFTFANPGTYKFYLVVNGQEEDEKVIRVNSQGSISAVMTCNPEFVTEDVNSVSCRVDVDNLGETTEDIWIINIYFAGGEIYDRSSGDNLVTPSPSKLTLNPYSTGAFTFMIPINDELQKRIPVDLSDINPGTPIAIKAYLNQLETPTMFVIEMNPQPVTTGDIAKAVYSGVKKVKDEIIGTFTDVKSLVSGGLSYIGLTEIVGVSASTAGAISGGVVLYLRLWRCVANTPVSEDTGDNNLIIGD